MSEHPHSRYDRAMLRIILRICLYMAHPSLRCTTDSVPLYYCSLYNVSTACCNTTKEYGHFPKWLPLSTGNMALSYIDDIEPISPFYPMARCIARKIQQVLSLPCKLLSPETKFERPHDMRLYHVRKRLLFLIGYLPYRIVVLALYSPPQKVGPRLQQVRILNSPPLCPFQTLHVPTFPSKGSILNRRCV